MTKLNPWVDILISQWQNRNDEKNMSAIDSLEVSFGSTETDSTSQHHSFQAATEKKPSGCVSGPPWKWPQRGCRAAWMIQEKKGWVCSSHCKLGSLHIPFVGHFFENELIDPSWVRNKKHPRRHEFSAGSRTVLLSISFRSDFFLFFLACFSNDDRTFCVSLAGLNIGNWQSVQKWRWIFFSPRLAPDIPPEANIVSSQPPVFSHVDGSKKKAGVWEIRCVSRISIKIFLPTGGTCAKVSRQKSSNLESSRPRR